MRLSKSGWLLAALGMTLGVFGVAAAQTGSPGASPPPGATVQAPREVDLPPAEQVALARKYVAAMDTSSSAIRSKLEKARAARDVVKSLCLNDKLNQINVAKRSARDRLQTLAGIITGAKVTDAEKDMARHEFMLLLELRDRADQIVKEANQCIGEEAGYIGETDVSMTVPDDLPDNDPDELGVDPVDFDEPPVVAVSPIN